MDTYNIKIAMLASPGGKCQHGNTTIEFVNDIPMRRKTVDFRVDAYCNKEALLDRIRTIYSMSHKSFAEYVSARMGAYKFAQFARDTDFVLQRIGVYHTPLAKSIFCKSEYIQELKRTDVPEYLFCEYVKTDIKLDKIVSIELHPNEHRVSLVAKDVSSLGREIVDIAFTVLTYFVDISELDDIKIVHVPRSVLGFAVCEIHAEEEFASNRALKYLQEEYKRNHMYSVQSGFRQLYASLSENEDQLSRIRSFIEKIDFANSVKSGVVYDNGIPYLFETWLQ